MKRGQKAWLLFWDWCGEHAAVQDKVAAILSPRLSQQYIGRLVEQLYGIHLYSAAEHAAYAKWPKKAPYRAQWYIDHCTCGQDPFLNAMNVHDLQVTEDPTTGLETISYVIPAAYEWRRTADLKDLVKQQVREESAETITRTKTGPFSSCEIGRYVPS